MYFITRWETVSESSSYVKKYEIEKKKKKKGGTKQSSNAELCLEELREFVHI